MRRLTRCRHMRHRKRWQQHLSEVPERIIWKMGLEGWWDWPKIAQYFYWGGPPRPMGMAVVEPRIGAPTRCFQVAVWRTPCKKHYVVYCKKPIGYQAYEKWRNEKGAP